MYQELGVYIIAPVLSTLSAGALMFTGRYFLKTGKILSDLEARVANNEDDIEYIQDRVNRLAEQVG